MDSSFFRSFQVFFHLNDIRRRLAGREKSLRGGPPLFESEPSTDPVVNRFVDDFWERLVKGGRIANTVRHQLKINTLPVGAANNADKFPEDNSIHNDRREIVRTMNTQKVVTTTVLNKNNEVVILRQCNVPNEKVKRIYDKLAYRRKPFEKKKFVVHKSFFEKMQVDEIQLLYSQ